MRIVKYLAVWLAGLLLCFAASDLVGAVLVRKSLGQTYLNSLTGYSRKMRLPVSPADTADEQKQNAAALYMRALLSDMELRNHGKLLNYLLFTECELEQSLVFLNEEGRHSFSDGTYAAVMRESDESIDMFRTIGLVDVGVLSASSCADELLAALRDDRDARVVLESYTMEEDLHVQPVRIAVLDAAGQTLMTAELPAEGTVIEEEGVYIDNPLEYEGDPSNLYEKLRYMRRGERPCQRRSAALSGEVPVGGADCEEDGHTLGLAQVTLWHWEVREGRGEAAVLTVYYLRSVLLYTGIAGVLCGLVLVIV